MSTQYLFDRQWSITLGIGGKIVDVTTTNDKQVTTTTKGNVINQNTGYQYASAQNSGLRTVFDIDKTSQSSSNKAKIEIHNLSASSRQQFQKGTQLWLQAGYKGLMKTLYVGDANPNGVRSKREGADIVTSFECGNFEKNLVYSHFDKSYPAGVAFSQIVSELALAIGADIGVIIGMPMATSNMGFTATGSIKDSLDTLLKPQNMEWHIDNNTINIYPKGQHLGETAILVSNDPKNPTGLIGVPSNGDGFVEFISLLNPDIAPGVAVQLVSETINGFFKIRRAHYEGDTHGEKWQVTCEGLKIDDVQVSKRFNINTASSNLGIA